MEKNLLIVEERETGKTTYLLEELQRYINEGYNVIVLDSATDHKDKSLLRKTISLYPEALLIDNHDKNKLCSLEDLSNGKNLISSFPYYEIKNHKENIICFDLSYFLELGHEAYESTQNQVQYEYYRNLYRTMAQQIISTIISMDYKGFLLNTVVITDEIEFPIVDFDISVLQRNIRFLSAVHPENAFGTFYKSYEQIKFLSYQKRKRG